MSKATQEDLDVVAAQLQRTPRDVHAVAHRCPCGAVDVVATPPRLADGTPFPTFYYATCPKLTAAISTLESSGLMIAMNEKLQSDSQLQNEYLQAHKKYEAARDEVAAELNLNVPEVKGTTAGGMPDRVKCLHSLIAHSLAVGEGVNPLGDEALAKLPNWWLNRPCSEIANLLDRS